MRLLIDGHNLIPYLPGLSLRHIDDEQALIDLLQPYASATRRVIEVFFDGAPPGHAGTRVVGNLTAHFVPERTIADAAIRRRLKELGAQAKDTSVVSSDRQVQAEARSAGAKPLHSDLFARELVSYLPARRPPKPPEKKPQIEPPRPADEVQNWLEEFKKRPKKTG